jgi:PEP-CTERM motif
MKKSSFFLALAGGLLASTAFAMPSQAGTVIIEAGFNITPSTVTATDISVTLNGFAPTSITDYTILSPSGVLPGASVIGDGAGGVVTISFPAVNHTSPPGPNNTPFEVAFSTNATGILTYNLSGASGGFTNSGLNVGLVVPEPSSMALLGIGMTGFLAFRRFFKRTRVA